MIKCDRHRALIPESTCIARQRIIQKSGAWNTYRRVASLEVQYACKGCEIGEKLLRGESVMAHQKTKICRICGQEKAVKEFYVYKAAKDGRESLCKACKTEKRKERERGQTEKARALTNQEARPERTGQEQMVFNRDQEGMPCEFCKHYAKNDWVYCILCEPGESSNYNAAEFEVEMPDTIKKNDHSVDENEMVANEMDRILKKLLENQSSHDLDRMIKQLFVGTYPPGLYDSLVQSAYLDTRPIHMQLIFLAKCQLENRGLV